MHLVTYAWEPWLIWAIEGLKPIVTMPNGPQNKDTQVLGAPHLLKTYGLPQVTHQEYNQGAKWVTSKSLQIGIVDNINMPELF